MHISFSHLAAVLVAPLMVVSSPILAAEPEFADPEQIDRLVEGFTGKLLGASGGARAPVDRRLRLRACAVPLELDWYGDPGRTVQVECAGQGGWRIYVNLLRGELPRKIGPAVNRGDMITVAIKGRGFSVQKQGEAQESGGVGDWIEIRTGKDAPVIRAQIENPGLAIITAD